MTEGPRPFARRQYDWRVLAAEVDALAEEIELEEQCAEPLSQLFPCENCNNTPPSDFVCKKCGKG